MVCCAHCTANCFQFHWCFYDFTVWCSITKVWEEHVQIMNLISLMGGIYTANSLLSHKSFFSIPPPYLSLSVITVPEVLWVQTELWACIPLLGQHAKCNILLAVSGYRQMQAHEVPLNTLKTSGSGCMKALKLRNPLVMRLREPLVKLGLQDMS